MGRDHPPGEWVNTRHRSPADAAIHSKNLSNADQWVPAFAGTADRRSYNMPDADIRIIATGLGFPEGPVWMADGSVILGEISGKKVTRVAPDGTKTEIGRAGGGPNGCATGPDGALYVCNNGGAVYETTPSFLSTGPAPDYKNG